MTITKTRGVLTTDHLTIVKLQEMIWEYTRQYSTGKVVIDAEKITFYKFGLPTGRMWHLENGLVYNNGHLSYQGGAIPGLHDQNLGYQLLILFNMEQ